MLSNLPTVKNDLTFVTDESSLINDKYLPGLTDFKVYLTDFEPYLIEKWHFLLILDPLPETFGHIFKRQLSIEYVLKSKFFLKKFVEAQKYISKVFFKKSQHFD